MHHHKCVWFVALLKYCRDKIMARIRRVIRMMKKKTKKIMTLIILMNMEYYK